MGKVNFVEIRSFWHIFRSFDRMWSFFILCLQVPIFASQYFYLSNYPFISSFIPSIIWNSVEVGPFLSGYDHCCLEWHGGTNCNLWLWCIQESIECLYNCRNFEARARWVTPSSKQFKLDLHGQGIQIQNYIKLQLNTKLCKTSTSSVFILFLSKYIHFCPW